MNSSHARVNFSDLHQTHPSRLASDDQDVEGRSTVQTALEAEKGADQQPLPLSSKAASLTFAATSDEEAASRPDENVRLEVTHLRRVNEALVERIESMERSQAQSMVRNTTGPARWAVRRQPKESGLAPRPKRQHLPLDVEKEGALTNVTPRVTTNHGGGGGKGREHVANGRGGGGYS